MTRRAIGHAIAVTLAISGLLICAPVAGLAQQPSPSPSLRDTAFSARMQQMMGMFNEMGPMYETMTKGMIEGTLKALGDPENVERMAVFMRRYYLALIKQGFTKDEALQIVAGAGLLAQRAGR
jgi:hypothetical protein